MGGGKGILEVFFWFSGLVLMALPGMMGIYGPYIDSAMLMSYIVNG